jgi:hypothetical protein
MFVKDMMHVLFVVNQIIHDTLSIATNNSPTLHEARASRVDLTKSLFSSNSFISPIVIYFYYASLLCIYMISNFLRYRKDYLFFVLLMQISIVECHHMYYLIHNEVHYTSKTTEQINQLWDGGTLDIVNPKIYLSHNFICCNGICNGYVTFILFSSISKT